MTGLAVPTPASVVPGGYDTAALWNANVYNGLQFLLNPPLFEGYQSAAQSVANGSVTAIGIDTTTIDTYGGHSNTTNNSRYTCQTGAAGWYQVIACLGFAANANGSRALELHKNGTVIKLGYDGSDNTRIDIAGALQATALIQLAVGDYVEAFAYQTSGGSLATNAVATGMTVIWKHA
ncbi:hypothetical protein ABZW30_12365 [Kitasatospora sp. NPDC004669]|uniref:hypothetical protein n=1 Tax=Kitasatospora sp. NPDC004669 TaxID=3154555 RepID=UPI0033AE66E4